MARTGNFVDNSIYQAALEGLELQKKRIEDQIGQVREMLAGKTKPATSVAAATEPASEKPKKRKLSKAAKDRISAAQKKRWDAYREKQEAKNS